MKNLSRGDEDAWAVFEFIRDAKRGGTLNILNSISAVVQQRYEQYKQHQRSLEHIPPVETPFTGEERQALSHCYDVSTSPLAQLKQRIKGRQSSHARSKCPYCGIDRPRTWDHYLPRESFPEFSVHPDNLVPCCPSCNWTRGTHWRDEGERLHINPYFDEVEERERFLFAQLVFEGAELIGVRFYVDPRQGKNQAFAWRYQRHCTALNLLEQFEEVAPAHLERLAGQIRSSAVNPFDAASVAHQLRNQTAELQHLLGANNWEVALLAAAAESPAFIDYCLRPLQMYGEVST